MIYAKKRNAPAPGRSRTRTGVSGTKVSALLAALVAAIAIVQDYLAGGWGQLLANIEGNLTIILGSAGLYRLRVSNERLEAHP